MRFGRALLVALALAYGFAVSCATVHAAGLDEAIAHFTTDDFDETLTGIKEVAASGNPRAEMIISALQSGQLMFSAERKAVYIQDGAGKLTDAATGEPVAGAPPADLDTVNINNRLRGAIAAALGQLTLLSNDPQKRYEAAQAVFKSRAADALPTLETAIAKETDSRTKVELELARAAILLNMAGTSDADKLAAIAIVGDRGDQEALALLADIPARESPTVARAAIDAINAIQTPPPRPRWQAQLFLACQKGPAEGSAFLPRQEGPVGPWVFRHHQQGPVGVRDFLRCQERRRPRRVAHGAPSDVAGRGSAAAAWRAQTALPRRPCPTADRLALADRASMPT